MTPNPSHGGNGQLANDKPRPTEDDIQREQLGPRGVPGKADPAKMTPQRKKKTPSYSEPDGRSCLGRARRGLSKAGRILVRPSSL